MLNSFFKVFCISFESAVSVRLIIIYDNLIIDEEFIKCFQLFELFNLNDVSFFYLPLVLMRAILFT